MNKQTRTTRRASRKAFTLLEVLLAAAMAAVLAGALYATLQIAFRARATAESRVADFRRAELVAELICSELRQAVVPNGILAGTFYAEDAAGPAGPDSDSVEFYRAAEATDQQPGQGDIMMVQLLCQPSATGAGMDLIRRERRNLLAPTFYDLPDQVLARGVLGFNLRYFDGTVWAEGWDSSVMENSLPLAIEVDVRVAAEEDAPFDPAGADGAATHRATHVIWLPASTLDVGLEIEVAP